MKDNLILQAIEENDIEKLTDQLKNQSSGKILSTHDYINLLHTSLKPNSPSYKVINKIIENARNYKHDKKQNTAGKDPIYKIINSRSDDETKRTSLQIALEKSNPKKKIIKLLINNGTDISYRYTGSPDVINQRTLADNYLHIAAKTRNIDAFLLIFKKGMESNIRLLECNNNHENPLHIAARNGILPVILKGMFSYLQSAASDEIKKLKHSIKKEDKINTKEDQKKLRRVKAKLENNENYIRNALYSKYALNKEGKDPLSYISKEEKENIKKAVGIKDKLICSKKLGLCLCIAGTIGCIAVLCTCVLLFPASQAFVLSSIVSMVIGGMLYLPLKACSAMHELHNEGAPMQEPEVTQLSEGLTTTP